MTDIKRGTLNKLPKRSQMQLVAQTTGYKLDEVTQLFTHLFNKLESEVLQGKYVSFGALFEFNASHTNKLISTKCKLPHTLGYYITQLDQEDIKYLSNATRLHLLLIYLELIEKEVLQNRNQVVIPNLATIKFRSTGVVGIAISTKLTRLSSQFKTPLRVRLQTPFKRLVMSNDG